MQKSTFFPEIKTARGAYLIIVFLWVGVFLAGKLQAQGIIAEKDGHTEWGDVVITEIMADPQPPVKWEEEYIELYNRSERLLDLHNWSLKVGERKLGFPPESVADSMIPCEYRVLVLSSLPNEGSTIQVLDERGTLIHAVRYRSPPFAPGWKEEGGWSLESPDPELVCNVYSRWSYSCDPSGGTPGSRNCRSLEVDDLSSPVFLYHGFSRSGELFLQFSESLFLQERTEASIRIWPGNFRPLLVVPSYPFPDRLHMVLPTECRGRDELRITLPALPDCSGNQGHFGELRAGRAGVPRPGSVWISEIMFRPDEGKGEFLEIYNPGPEYIDLQDIAVGIAVEGMIPESFCALSGQSRIICPGQYVVCCRRSDELMLAYGLEPEGTWVEVDCFPALHDGGGEVVLADRAGNKLDRAPYNDEMHLELLADHRGISLERMNFGHPASDPANWHSAASTSSGSTPGRENSQQMGLRDAETVLLLEPKVFSPDNDGFEDVLRIGVQSGDPGTMIRLWVSDPAGRVIRILADGEVGGNGNQYAWDGRNDQGYLQQEGFYVVHLHTLNPGSGKQERRREACGLVYR